MDSENQIQTESLLDLIDDQAGILVSIISRPVVLIQILAILIIIFVSFFLPRIIQRWYVRKYPPTTTEVPDDDRSESLWLEAVKQLFSPFLAFLLINFTIWLFSQFNYPNGLLQDLINLILVWLAYKVVVTILRVRYGAKANPYRRRIVTPIFVGLVVLQILYIWPGSLSLVTATITFGTITFPFFRLVAAFIILYIFITSAWLIERLIVYSLPQRMKVETGFVESMATLARYSILTIGIIFSLGSIGLDFTSLTIVAGGLSVGIGIGLQEIVANFISGLVLLFEQSLRPGDVIELDGSITRVEKVSLRATTVRTITNEELIIPNARFTTQQVRNLTKSERLVKLTVPFGVSYASDPELVKKLAIETSLQHPNVLAAPPPELLFKAYGNSSLDFDLLVSIVQPQISLRIRSDLYYRLWQTFAEHDITIPFPQRDLNLGTGWESLLSEMARNDGDAEDSADN